MAMRVCGLRDVPETGMMLGDVVSVAFFALILRVC